MKSAIRPVLETVMNCVVVCLSYSSFRMYRQITYIDWDVNVEDLTFILALKDQFNEKNKKIGATNSR